MNDTYERLARAIDADELADTIADGNEQARAYLEGIVARLPYEINRNVIRTEYALDDTKPVELDSKIVESIHRAGLRQLRYLVTIDPYVR